MQIHLASQIPSPLWGGTGRGWEVIVLAGPVADTCKEVIDGLVIRTVPRDTLVDARGPWLFERGALAAAVSRVGDQSEPANMLDFCRAAGLRVHLEPIE